MTPKTKQELNQLAYDIYKGLVFTDRHIREEELHTNLRIIFLPIGIMDKDTAKRFWDTEPGLIYEYRDQANRRISIDGYPLFYSARSISRADAEIVFAKVQELQKAEQEAIEDTE